MRLARRPLPPSKPWIVRAVAEKILAQLEQTDSQLPVEGLRNFARDLLDDLDLRRSELGAATAVAIAQIREPPAVVDSVVSDLAVVVAQTPEELRDNVIAASPDLAAGTGSRELLAVDIQRAEQVNALFYAGDAFRALFERELPIVVVAASVPSDEEAVDTLFAGFYDAIVEQGLQASVSHVGRFTAQGAQGAAYRAAERVESVERIGVCAPVEPFLTAPMAAVHKGMFLGRSRGDEVWLLRELAQRGVAIVLGGDDQALDDARVILPRAGNRAICCSGFGFDSPADLKELTGTADAVWIPNASTDPMAGRRLGGLVAEIFKGGRSTFWRDPLLSVAFRQRPDVLSDLVDGLFENASRNRIVRLITAVSNRLERAGIPSPQVWCEVSDLTQELARRVLEIPEPQNDPHDNALWQQRAKEAFNATGSRVLMDVIVDVEQDIYYASWHGIKKKISLSGFDPDEP